MVTCRVKGCSRRSSGGGGTKFHSFPTKHPHLCALWNNACWRASEGVASWKNFRVCSSHFSADDFEDVNGKSKLKQSAVPRGIILVYTNSLTHAITHNLKESHIRWQLKLIQKQTKGWLSV
jgi:hypothetical protein